MQYTATGVNVEEGEMVEFARNWMAVMVWGSMVEVAQMEAQMMEDVSLTDNGVNKFWTCIYFFIQMMITKSVFYLTPL